MSRSPHPKALTLLVKRVGNDVTAGEATKAQDNLRAILSEDTATQAPHDEALGLLAALGRCATADLPEGLVRELLDFRGKLIGGVIVAASAASAISPSLTAHRETIDELFATSSEFAGIKGTLIDKQQTETWVSVMQLIFSWIDYKRLVGELQIASGGSAVGDDAGTAMANVLTSRSVLMQKVKVLQSDGTSPSCGGYVAQAVGVVTEHIDSTDKLVNDQKAAARTSLTNQLSKCRVRLEKVASGGDNGASWKADVPPGAEVGAMSHAIGVLEKAYIEACQTRLQAAKEVKPTTRGVGRL